MGGGRPSVEGPPPLSRLRWCRTRRRSGRRRYPATPVSTASRLPRRVRIDASDCRQRARAAGVGHQPVVAGARIQGADLDATLHQCPKKRQCPAAFAAGARQTRHPCYPADQGRHFPTARSRTVKREKAGRAAMGASLPPREPGRCASGRTLWSQFAPQDLADRRLGQLVPELDAARPLVAGEVLAAVGQKLGFRQLRVLPDDE